MQGFADGRVELELDKRGVATVWLNRPERNNAYDGELILGLLAAFGELAGDPDVRIVVLRGRGKHFQVGADLSWLKAVATLSPEENVQISRNTFNAVHGLLTFPVPTVALIHGGCFGGGTGIAAAADIVVASEDAIFSITEARWGVMAGIIIPHLNAAIGPRNVRRYAATCERFDARTAKELGLVHQLCETGGLEQAGATIIDGLLMSAPDALRQTKMRTLKEAGLLLRDAQIEELVQEHSAKRQSGEADEGLASFLEKRPPSWYRG